MTEASWRDVKCKTCGAPAGQKCFSGNGRPAQEPHAARRRTARETGMPAPLLGYPAEAEHPHIVSLADRSKALCGLSITSVPTVQPQLEAADPKCRDLLGIVPYAVDEGPTGVCPVCGSDETLDGDLIPAHRQLVVGKGGIRRTTDDCEGKGQPPEPAP